MIEGVSGAITLSIKLLAIYAVWLSVLEMTKRTGIDKRLSKILKPVAKKLFKGEKEEAYDWICVNVSANMLGMGGVATPAAIKAMEQMQDGSDKATHNMALLFTINALVRFGGVPIGGQIETDREAGGFLLSAKAF